jgi:hypothetical protein
MSRFATTDWCATQPHCKGNLGIPRNQMPQIPEEQLPEFITWLESKGVRARVGRKAVGELKATQKEINAQKVENMRGKNLGNAPIIVSKDGYVLDGHHRWAALLAEDPGNLINTIQVSLPIRVLLKVGFEFPGVFVKDLADTRVASTGFDVTAHVVKWRHIFSL